MITHTIEEDTKGRSILHFTPDTSMKTCCFDCVYCPLGRTDIKVEAPTVSDHSETWQKELRKLLSADPGRKAEFVAFDTTGESLIYRDLEAFCDIVHQSGKKVMLETVGCWLNDEDIRRGVRKCDELTIELQDTSAEMFQKIHRPASGVTFDDLISGYRKIRNWYNHCLIVKVYLVNKYNDDPDSIQFLKGILKDMAPDEIRVSTLHDERLKGLCIEEPRASRLVHDFDEFI